MPFLWASGFPPLLREWVLIRDNCENCSIEVVFFLGLIYAGEPALALEIAPWYRKLSKQFLEAGGANM